MAPLVFTSERAGSSLLVGVTASDPLTFAAVSLLVTAVAAAASYFPARRAIDRRSDRGTASGVIVQAIRSARGVDAGVDLREAPR